MRASQISPDDANAANVRMEESNVPAAPTELHRQSGQFKPMSHRLARNLVIDAGASTEVRA
jgi:hypothetical protein